MGFGSCTIPAERRDGDREAAPGRRRRRWDAARSWECRQDTPENSRCRPESSRWDEPDFKRGGKSLAGVPGNGNGTARGAGTSLKNREEDSLWSNAPLPPSSTDPGCRRGKVGSSKGAAPGVFVHTGNPGNGGVLRASPPRRPSWRTWNLPCGIRPRISGPCAAPTNPSPGTTRCVFPPGAGIDPNPDPAHALGWSADPILGEESDGDLGSGDGNLGRAA